MDADSKAIARAVLATAPAKIVRLYTEYALLLNAFDLARREYESRRSPVVLSTTVNIPGQLRLPTEVDVTFDRARLVTTYESALPLSFCRGFLVDLVAHLDAWMEDVFEQLLPICRTGLSPTDLERRVRSAWTDDQGVPALRRFFLIDLALKPPAGRVSTPDMVFDRYEEMRELRHAVMHTDGRLTAKHVAKLTTLGARLPGSPLPDGGTMVDVLVPEGLKEGSEVSVGAIELLHLRKWAFDSLSYFQAAFNQS